MRVRDRRYWLGVSPWVFIPVLLCLVCVAAVLLDPVSLWLRVPVMGVLLLTWVTYVERTPWVVRWNRRWGHSRWGGERPAERGR